MLAELSRVVSATSKSVVLLNQRSARKRLPVPAGSFGAKINSVKISTVKATPMSNESRIWGEITLPEDSLHPVKELLVEAYNAEQRLAFDLALELYMSCEEFHNPEGNFLEGKAKNLLGYTATHTSEKILAFEAALDFARETNTAEPSLSDFPLDLPVSPSQDFSLSLFGITVSFKGTTLTYDSGLGNYRADLTSSSKIYKTLVETLDAAEFPEGTGGYLKKYSDLIHSHEEDGDLIWSWGDNKDK